MLVLVVELKARPECRARLETVLRELVRTASSEAGILCYTVQQPEDRPETFILYECYRDRTAWQEHLALAAVSAALKEFETLLAAPAKVTFCQPFAGTPPGWPR